jgi:hypothetical protein
MWWTISPLRNSMVTELPFDPRFAADWLRHLRIVAGLDGLGLIAAALWVVVTMRLPVPLWLRALSSSVCLFVLVVVTLAFSITNASVAQMTADRSVFFDDEGSIDPQLIVGYTPDYLVTLHVQAGAALIVNEPSADAENAIPPADDDDSVNGRTARLARGYNAVIEMSDRPARLTVVGRQSIVDFMINRVPRPE